MEMYEARPSLRLMQGVTLAEHERAMAEGPDDFDWPDWEEEDPIARMEDNDDNHEWLCRNGKCIKYRKLEDSHLRNIIAYLERSSIAKSWKSIFPNLVAEIRRRGAWLEVR